jgi:hypothetical protein
MSVAVDHTPEGVVWRDLGWDALGKPDPPPTPRLDDDEPEPESAPFPGRRGPELNVILARTGPFLFDTTEYVSAVSQYRHVRRSRGG